jgi:hypothetical protein
MDGVDAFVARRKQSKERSMHGGAMTDLGIFGLT